VSKFIKSYLLLGVDFMIYLGIDVAKNKHDICVVDSNANVLLEPFTFYNSVAGFKFLLEKLKPFDLSDSLFGLESTGHYGENLINFLHKQGFKLGIINPIQTDALRNTNIRKTKNDKIDTKLVAKALILGNYTPFVPKDLTLLELRSLCRHRDDILKSRSKLKVRLVAFTDQLFPELNYIFNSIHQKSCYALLAEYPAPTDVCAVRVDKLSNLLRKASKGHFGLDKATKLKELAKSSIGINNSSLSIQIKHSLKQIELLNEQIDELDNKIKEVMDEIASPILSIPGISYTLGSIIISEIGNIERFSSPCKLLAFAGLDPTVKQSGTFNATHIKMSKRGSKLLRYALIKAASITIWNSETFNTYYSKKISQGKSHNNVVCHVAHKLVRIVFKILKENINFKEQSI